MRRGRDARSPDIGIAPLPSPGYILNLFNEILPPMAGSKQKHAGSNTKLQKPNPDVACMDKMKPFFENMPLFRKMATQLEIDVDFIVALSSMESGWLDPHNQGLHNLFGVTKAGGNNLSFETYEKGADFWIDHFGGYVKASRTMEDFAEGLKKARYNSVNKDYYTHLVNQLRTVRKYKTACKVE